MAYFIPDKDEEEDEMGDSLPPSLLFSLKNDDDVCQALTGKHLENSNENLSSENEMERPINTGNAIQGEFSGSSSPTRKSLKERLFSRIDAGSIRGSIFSMTILSLGSACLALPQKFEEMSALVGIIDIILAGMACYWTLNLLIIASHKVKIYEYSALIKKVFNRPMAMFLDITVLIYIFGIMILYQVISNINFI